MMMMTMMMMMVMMMMMMLIIMMMQGRMRTTKVPILKCEQVLNQDLPEELVDLREVEEGLIRLQSRQRVSLD